MLIRTIPFLVFFVVLLFFPTGCARAPEPPPPDFPNIAAAFKFVGCCSVICASIWAVAIIYNANRRGGR